MVMSYTTVALVKHRVNVQFVGNNNTLLIHNEAKELSGSVKFYGDFGHFSLGAMSSFRGQIIVGDKCRVNIGNKTTVTKTVSLIQRKKRMSSLVMIV